MELTSTTTAKIKALKDAGYSQSEVLAYFGAEQVGQRSSIHDEEIARAKAKDQAVRNSLTWRDVVAAPANFLAPSAIDTFGSYLARRGIGTDTDAETVQQFVDEPTARQMAGAVLQTGGLVAETALTVGSLGAATPLTLGLNVATGAGFGYMYDVGEDLIEQEKMKDILTPGFGTVVGAGAPLAFAGLGAGIRALRPTQQVAEQVVPQVADDFARSVSPVIREGATQGVEQAVEKNVSKTIDGTAEIGKNVANRFSRAGRHLQQTLDEQAARNALREGASDKVLFALDEGLDTNTITRLTQADDITKTGYRQIIEQAESGTPLNAEKVAGEKAVEMYRIASERQAEIGKQLGEARRALGNDIIDPQVYNPAMRTFGQTMRDNGIRLKADGTVEFTTQKFIPEEEKVIQEVWSRLAKYDSISPAEVDEVMQYLSKLEYRTNVTDKVGSVYINVLDTKTGETRPVNVFRHIRNTYDSLLEEVDSTGQIKQLRKDYSTVKSVTGDIEGSWFNGLDLQKTTDAELADAAALALRRLDQRAKSRTTYGQMYRALDGYARGNGYTGADASDLSNFYVSVVEPMYKETTPAASFRGSITGGIRSVFENVFDFGKANADDKRKALKGLLDMEDISRPVNPAATVETQLPDNPNVSSDYSITPREGSRGFVNFFGRAQDRTPKRDIPQPQPGARALPDDASSDLVLETLATRTPQEIVAGYDVDIDDVLRLEALRDKMRNGPLDAEDIAEAKNLLNKYGESF